MRKMKLILEEKEQGLDSTLDSVSDLETLPEVDPSFEEVAAGISGMLNNLIIDEWATVDAYNSAIATIKASNVNQQLLNIIQDIVDEEMVHIGQLQTALTLVVPNVPNLEKGKEEAEKQLGEVEEVSKPAEEPEEKEVEESFGGWRNTVKEEAVELRKAINADSTDINNICEKAIKVLEKCKEFFDAKEQDYVIEEIDELIEDFESLDADYSEEDDVDYMLTQLYDFCDGYRIFLALD